MRLFIKLTGILGSLIFTNCSKEKDVILNINNQPAQSNIFYQEFTVDTTSNENDTILYDIDGDFNFNFELIKTIEIINQFANVTGSIKSITDTAEFTYLKTSPTMDFIDLGDNIFDSTTYIWYNDITYTSNGTFASTNYDWTDNVFTDYFGFQLTRNGNKYYGWFRLKRLEIKEIGFNKTPGESIFVGQKK